MRYIDSQAQRHTLVREEGGSVYVVFPNMDGRHEAVEIRFSLAATEDLITRLSIYAESGREKARMSAHE